MKKNICNVFTEDGIILPYKGITSKYIENVILKSLGNINKNNTFVTIIITTNDYIKKINMEYREKDYATDVISFAYEEEPFPQIEEISTELGDIYISIEKAEEQFEDFSDNLNDEIKRLLIHGLLHLCGYDHEISKEEEIRMEEMELKLIDSL